MAQVVTQPMRILYVNTKDFQSGEAGGRRLDFASFSGRAAALGALNFNSIIFYQFHHFRDNPALRAQVLEAMGFAAKMTRDRGEILHGGTHIFPPLFRSDPQYREDLEKFFSEVQKTGAEPLAATGNTSWIARNGSLVERPELLAQLRQIADWCTKRKIPLYVISDMSTTFDAKAARTQYPDAGDDGKELPRVLDIANPAPAKLYQQFFANLAELNVQYPALVAAGLEEFPQQGRFLQDDQPVLYGYSEAGKARYARENGGKELRRYDRLGGSGNAERMAFLDDATRDFFAEISPSRPGFQVTHLNNYIANWRYKMSLPRGNMSGDPYVYDSWMLPAPVTFLQPSRLEADPALASRFNLLMLHPRGRALNQWHLEKRTAQFGSDRVAASWPYFMAGAGAPLVGYLDQLAKLLPHFKGTLVLPYRITSRTEDEALAQWVECGNILVLGSFAGEAEDGRLDPAREYLPAKWSEGKDSLLKAAGWQLPQSVSEVRIGGDPLAQWRDVLSADTARVSEFPLSAMAGRSLALPKAPHGTVTLASLDGKPYIQGVQLGKGWLIWHNILPFADSQGRLSARYDSQEGWLPLRNLPTELLRATLRALKLPAHTSDNTLIFGNGLQTMEVEIARSLEGGAPGYRAIERSDRTVPAVNQRPAIRWQGGSAASRVFWEKEFARYWPERLPEASFLKTISEIQVEIGQEEVESFSVSLRGSTLQIKAANSRSGLLALYRLLEKVGWRWVRPGVDRFSVDWIVQDRNALQMSVRPALAIRGMMTHTPVTEKTLAWVDWLPKAGYNFFLIPGPYWDNAPASVKRALDERQILVEVGAHSFDYWYPHQRYFSTAPETFAMVKGSRELPAARWIDDLLADRQVATTHPAVPPAFAQAIDDFTRKSPGVARVSLWPNDGFGWDESPEAKALDRDGMSLLHPAYPNYARRYLIFSRAVQALRRTNTPATLIAYAATLQFPEGEELPRGTPVYVAPYLENYASPLPQERSAANACYWRETTRWIKAGAKVTLFEYWLKYAWLSQPLPIITQQQENIQALAGAGGNGLLTQAELDGWEVNSPLYYVGGRLLVEPDADARKLLREYFEAAAGKAAGQLLADFWESLENQLRSAGELTAFGANLPKVFTPEILQRWAELVAALERIDSEPARDSAKIWAFRLDVIRRILDMLSESRSLASVAVNDSQGTLQGYADLVASYDRLLADIRSSPFREDFDPLLPKFLASNVLRPVVKSLKGVVIPETLVRDRKAGAL